MYELTYYKYPGYVGIYGVKKYIRGTMENLKQDGISGVTKKYPGYTYPIASVIFSFPSARGSFLIKLTTCSDVIVPKLVTS